MIEFAFKRPAMADTIMRAPQTIAERACITGSTNKPSPTDRIEVPQGSPHRGISAQ